jgi:hypothetical protein
MAKLKPFLDWPNANSGAFTVLFTAVVAVATVFYVRLTRALVAETRRMRKVQTEPQVTVRVESSEKWISMAMLVIENIGGGPAFDLKLASIPDFVGIKDRPLSQFGPFKHGVRVLTPGQKISTLLVNLVDRVGELEDPAGPLSLTVKAEYRGTLGEKYESSFPIDFLHMIGSRSFGKPPLHAIAGSLDEIQKELSRFGGGTRRLQVIAYSPEDVRRELDEDMAQMQRSTIPENNRPGD